ncbi:hypothetical protein cyc_05418 [Cyclospora cayetanensis]|uniref:Uncharacterized protein n=1 Tax=Cyclospora cayetanensis TaxID=88456 RepID=A0A1D3D7K2_9EIME|nr:hypothetical protein cyc_05418 [Cyclospora cayetanensis]
MAQHRRRSSTPSKDAAAARCHEQPALEDLCTSREHTGGFLEECSACTPTDTVHREETRKCTRGHAFREAGTQFASPHPAGVNERSLKGTYQEKATEGKPY